jgi:hypothetical protein
MAVTASQDTSAVDIDVASTQANMRVQSDIEERVADVGDAESLALVQENRLM